MGFFTILTEFSTKQTANLCKFGGKYLELLKTLWFSNVFNVFSTGFNVEFVEKLYGLKFKKALDKWKNICYNRKKKV